MLRNTMANEFETFATTLRSAAKDFAVMVSEGANKVAESLHDPVQPLREALNLVWGELTPEQVKGLDPDVRKICVENHEIVSHAD